MSENNSESLPGNRLAAPRYRAFEEKLFDADIGAYVSYGIELTDGGIIDCLHDVSTERAEVMRACRLFNKYRLSPLHFRDAVDDFLAEGSAFADNSTT